MDEADAELSNDTVAVPADGHTGATTTASGNAAGDEPEGETVDDGIGNSTLDGSAAAIAAGGNPTANPATTARTSPKIDKRR